MKGNEIGRDLRALDELEVALRHLLSVRERALEVASRRGRSARLSPAAVPVIDWLRRCAKEDIVGSVMALRAAIEAEGSSGG
jgi:hypothetical protein